jgi:hypothetical protein
MERTKKPLLIPVYLKSEVILIARWLTRKISVTPGPSRVSDTELGVLISPLSQSVNQMQFFLRNHV